MRGVPTHLLPRQRTKAFAPVFDAMLLGLALVAPLSLSLGAFCLGFEGVAHFSKTFDFSLFLLSPWPYPLNCDIYSRRVLFWRGGGYAGEEGVSEAQSACSVAEDRRTVSR